MLRAVLLSTLLLLAQVTLAAQEDWVIAAKARSPEDISLWTRTVPGAELKAFRGAMHTDAPMASAVAMLYDATNMTEWIFRCREAHILGQAENGDTFIYLKIEGIWPVGDRDAIIRAHPVLNEATGELVIIGTAELDYIPPVDGYVRIPAIESTWRLTPTPGGLIRIEWTGHVDPAGYVPRWLTNALATWIPRHTLRQVRGLLDDPRWRAPAVQEKGKALLGNIRNIIR